MLKKSAATLIPLPGMAWMAEQIQTNLSEIAPESSSQIVTVDVPRFMTGDAKAVLQSSVRGQDVFVLVDVGNSQCTYEMFGTANRLSPDDHYQNLVRTISAIAGQAARVNVIMPLLYSARQDRRSYRESLDCAVALQHLESIGVKNIMSFDVHDVRVQNAIPFVSFDNLMPTYQVIKTLYNAYPDITFNEDSFVMVSPDFGGANRNLLYANELGLDIGLFYKRRNLRTVTKGQNAIEIHKYIGPELTGKDVIIADDMIASGDSILDSAMCVKKMGARRIFIATTFGFFTNGVKKFNELYEKGIFDKVLITNASFLKTEVVSAPWFEKVDIVKYISYYIHSVNIGASISAIMDPHIKIHSLLNYLQ